MYMQMYTIKGKRLKFECFLPSEQIYGIMTIFTERNEQAKLLGGVGGRRVYIVQCKESMQMHILQKTIHKSIRF